MSNKEPDDKDGLLEMIKKLWLPVAGFLGAITLAYNFYQLWLGDQGTVTWFLAGGGLIVLIIVLGWVSFKTRKIVERSQLLIIGQSNPEKIAVIQAYPHYYLPARIGFFLTLILTVVGTFILFQEVQARQIQQQVLATQTVIETQQAQQELKDKLIVVIASFDGPEEIYGLRNQIIEGINVEFSNSEDVKVVALKDVISPEKGSEYARSLGEEYFADLVIWGWYRPTENPNINIHIENLSSKQFEPLGESEIYQPVISLPELESFSFQQQAGRETSALLSFLNGLVKYQSGDYHSAINSFDKSISNLSTQPPIIKNLPQFYFYRANSYLILKDFFLALEDYSKAIELDPKYVAAYNNRGVAYAASGDRTHAI
jgi:tetratricopeptide (TPR) repeat protein